MKSFATIPLVLGSFTGSQRSSLDVVDVTAVRPASLLGAKPTSIIQDCHAFFREKVHNCNS